MNRAKVAAALAIAWIAIPTIVLGESAVDLRYVLAYPPTGEYIEAPPAPDILDGPFTAQQYADYVSAIGEDGSHLATYLRVYGFVRGYARTWVERGTHRVLIERVFEHSSGTGAGALFNAVNRSTSAAKQYQGAIDTAPIPDSFGAKLDEGSGATLFHDYVGVLLKGNDVYEALMGSDTDDLTSALQLQVHALFETAPPETIPKSQWTNPLTAAVTNSFRVPSSFIVVGFVVLALVLGAVLLILLLALRRPKAGLAPMIPNMSPDGAYWWDGQRWREASSDPPNSASRSADGAYWWDGSSWRLMPAPRPFG